MYRCACLDHYLLRGTLSERGRECCSHAVKVLGWFLSSFPLFFGYFICNVRWKINLDPSYIEQCNDFMYTWVESSDFTSHRGHDEGRWCGVARATYRKQQK